MTNRAVKAVEGGGPGASAMGQHVSKEGADMQVVVYERAIKAPTSPTGVAKAGRCAVGQGVGRKIRRWAQPSRADDFNSQSRLVSTAAPSPKSGQPDLIPRVETP